MTLNCLIIDDEKLARALIQEYIEKIPALNLCGSFANPIAAQATLNTQDIHLIFLDVDMPQLSGIDFLKALRNPPHIILTTAHSDYALQAFELSVVDYLLKPIVFERFFQAVNKVLSIVPKTETTPAKQKNNPFTKAETPNDFLFIKSDKVIHKIFIKDILYIESLREYTRIHTKEQRVVAREALSKLIELLPTNDFTRIHRSYIINLQHIRNIEGNMIRIGEKTLPISKRKKEEFIKLVEKRGLIG